jgi:hypothetical protein
MSYCFLVCSLSQSRVQPRHCHRHYVATCLEEWWCAQCNDKYHDNLKSSGKITTDAALALKEAVVFAWSTQTYQTGQSSVK